MTPAKRKKFLKNLLKFSAPGIAVFFSQLAMGADPKVAFSTAALILYGLASDYFTKMK